MKHFRITLFENANNLCKDLAVLAASKNGGRELSISDLYIVGKGGVINYPNINSGVSIELIGDTQLCVDIKGADGNYHPALIIDETEIIEIAKNYSDELTGALTE